jgi:hypothetical protein
MANNTCKLCNEKIEEEHKKLKGTIVKVKDSDNKNQFAYVCSACQKKDDWLEQVKK